MPTYVKTSPAICAGVRSFGSFVVMVIVAISQSAFGVIETFVLPAGLKLTGMALPVESATETLTSSLLSLWVISVASPFFKAMVWVKVLGLKFLLPPRPLHRCVVAFQYFDCPYQVSKLIPPSICQLCMLLTVFPRSTPFVVEAVRVQL